MKPVLIIMLVLISVSCSVVSKNVRENAVSAPTFHELVNDVERYRNQLVILGGHVLDVQSQPDGSILNALQVPLKTGDRPGSKDHSQGRLVIHTSKFLDPEVYTKGRKITVAGKIISSSADKPADKTGAKQATSPLPHLKIETEELHLWPSYRTPRYRYPYNDPFWYWNAPWYGRHYPFYFHGLRHRHYHLRHHRHRR